MGKHVGRRNGGGFSLPMKTKKKTLTQADHAANIAKKEAKLAEEAVERAKKEEREAAEEARKASGKLSKKEAKRAALRKFLLKSGKLFQTDLEVKQLAKIQSPVAVAMVNVQDEAELRNQFYRQGTAGYGSKYFMASKYKFKFLLAKDGTPVAQIVQQP
mmetsp:Transcript_117936/g.333568  ORF Transcript_117936/g.333568 Transcript_117936/m.333568 type:complete len:159 (+) Transcript_117936:94-570(+)